MGIFEPPDIPQSLVASVAVVCVFPDSWGQLAGEEGGRVPSLSLALGHLKLIIWSWLCHKASLHERSPEQTAHPTVNMTAVARTAKHSLLECGCLIRKQMPYFEQFVFTAQQGGV